MIDDCLFPCNPDTFDHYDLRMILHGSLFKVTLWDSGYGGGLAGNGWRPSLGCMMMSSDDDEL